jgi:hypothetical protein
MFRLQDRTTLIPLVRNRILTLIEREDDTRSWGNFLIYFLHSTTMPYQPKGLGLHIYSWSRQPSICQDAVLICCLLRCCPSNHHAKDHKDEHYTTMQRTTKTNSTRLIPSMPTSGRILLNGWPARPWRPRIRALQWILAEISLKGRNNLQ